MAERTFAARVERFLDAWSAAPIQRTNPRHVISKQSTLDPDDPYAELVDTDLRAFLAENAQLRRKQHAAWQVVASLRAAAVAEGRDPYQDPIAQALSLALVEGEIAGQAEVPQAKPDPCGAYSRWHRYGGTLGPCIKPAGHADPARPDADWHSDASGAAWDPIPAAAAAANPGETPHAR